MFRKVAVWLAMGAALLALSMAALLSPFTFSYQSANAAGETAWVFDNPYAGVDWGETGYYRANLHTHTKLSDGGYEVPSADRLGTPQVVAQAYHAYQSGVYDFLALTDHHSYAPAVNPVTDPWASSPNISTPGMAGIIGNEISGIENSSDIGSLFTNFNYTGPYSGSGSYNVSGSSVNGGSVKASDVLTAGSVYDGGSGRFIFNHPGRTTSNSSASILSGSENTVGSLAYFRKLFKEYSKLSGLELINQADRHPNDRAFWDSLLTSLPADYGRNIFGYGFDDAHAYTDGYGAGGSTPGIGYSFSTFLMPAGQYASNPAQGLKNALDSGSSFFSSYSTIGKNSNAITPGTSWSIVNQKGTVAATSRSGPVPKVSSLVADEAAGTITITAANTDKIQWISANGAVVQTDTLAGGAGTKTLDLTAAGVDKYVRAVLTVNEAGDSPCQTFTQPVLILAAGTPGGGETGDAVMNEEGFIAAWNEIVNGTGVGTITVGADLSFNHTAGSRAAGAAAIGDGGGTFRVTGAGKNITIVGKGVNKSTKISLDGYSRF